MQITIADSTIARLRGMYARLKVADQKYLELLKCGPQHYDDDTLRDADVARRMIQCEIIGTIEGVLEI